MNRRFLYSIAFSVLLFLGILTALACSSPGSDENLQQKESSDTLTYLALGDSYTICQSVEEEERWPNLLRDDLNDMGLIVEKPKIIAKTGWRTDNLFDACISELDSTVTYDMVSLLIGVNNEFQQHTPESFEPAFKECLDLAIDYCKTGKAGVFVVSIPDYGYTPYGESNRKKISNRLKKWNSICEKTCKEYGVAFYNITPISQSDPEDLSLVAKDGLHPSGKQYQMWVDSFIDDVYLQFAPK